MRLAVLHETFMPNLYKIIGNRAKTMQDPNKESMPPGENSKRSGNQYAVPKTFPINKHGNEAFVDNQGETGKRPVKIGSKEGKPCVSVVDDLEDEQPEELDDYMVKAFKDKLANRFASRFTTNGLGGL